MPQGKKFTAEQIIRKLREAEVGLAQGKTVPEVVRKLGVTEQTYYRWKREYGGLRTDQAKRLKDLEKENARLKRRRLWLGDGSCTRLRPTHRKHFWTYDFVMDRTADGRVLRMLTIMDEFTREWLGRVGVKTLYIEPGSPWENGYIESFNGKLRDELLAREVFDTLLEAKVLIERWRKDYNTVRPHRSLAYRPPAPESRRPCPLASATPQQADRGDPLAGLPW